MHSQAIIRKSLVSNLGRRYVTRRCPRSVPSYSVRRFSNIPQGASPPQGQDIVDQAGAEDEGGKGKNADSEPNFRSTILKMLESAATTFASIAVLGCEVQPFLVLGFGANLRAGLRDIRTIGTISISS